VPRAGWVDADTADHRFLDDVVLSCAKEVGERSAELFAGSAPAIILGGGCGAQVSSSMDVRIPGR